MSASAPTSLEPKPAQPATSRWHLAGLVGVLLLAVGLHFYNLAQEGYANLYYAAAVKSMLLSWRNFFFVSFDPGGFVSVDKPPLGLWVQALSAWVFGFHGWALLLPQALAGVFSVALLYHLVRRVFGPTAGLIAALMLAVTPIFIAANRNNTMDSQLVFTSLLAAWVASLAAERGKLRWLLLCAILIGVGFNIKMLQAYMVLPACFLLYFVAAHLPWWKRLVHLSVATVILLAVSLSWAMVVDLTPPEARPYVGSSQDNTVMELVMGHNGASRLGQLAGLVGLQPKGPFGRPMPAQRPQQIPGALPGQPPANQQPGPIQPPGQIPGQPPGNPQPGQIQPPAHPQPGQVQPPNQLQPAQAPNQPAGRPGGLGDETGIAGPLRLLNRQLAGQITWLLPLALLGIIAAAWQTRLRWPLVPSHQQILLWAAWLLPQMIFFSYAGLFHRYYLEMMAPAIAALAAAGLVALWEDYRGAFSASGLSGWQKARSWLLPLALLGSAAFQAFILEPFAEWKNWLTPLVVGLSLLAGSTLILLRLRPALPRLRLGQAAATAGLLALLIAPTVWAAIPVWYSGDNGLPFAGPDVIRPGQRVQDAETPRTTRLTQFLLENWQDEVYLVAALNARTAAPFILSTGAPVIALGGFSGSDQILSADELAEWVAQGYVRFFLLPAPQIPPNQVQPGANPNQRQPGSNPNQPNRPVFPHQAPQSGPQSELMSWVVRTCRVIPPAVVGMPKNNPGETVLLWDCGSQPR